MQEDLPLFPEQAAAGARDLDHLYLFLLGNAAFFTGLICVLILFFAVRYRRQARVNRRGAPTGSLVLELLWSFIPLAIMLVSFGWGAQLYVRSHRPPADAIEIFVIGKQWMWKVQHAEGRYELNELHVPTGQPVKLTMVSEDVIHSFYVPAFRLKQDVLPGRYTTMWFEPTKPGEYHLFCAEYCGTSHSQMGGRVVVLPPEEYAEWVAAQEVETPVAAGRRLFERLRCDSCHGQESTTRGPALAGLFGRAVPLHSGESVEADVRYVRESIVNPGAAIVAGYENNMPTYQGQLSEEEILQLISYLRSLSAGN